MGAKPDKWMPWFIGDFDRATGHLNDAENLAYRRLLEWYWGNGRLPNDDVRLAAIVRKTPREWRKLRPALIVFFTIEAGQLVQKRCEIEWERALAAYRQRVAASEKAVAAKREKARIRRECGNRPVNRTDDRTVNRTVNTTTTTLKNDAPREHIVLQRERSDSRPEGGPTLALVTNAERAEVAGMMKAWAEELGGRKKMAAE